MRRKKKTLTERYGLYDVKQEIVEPYFIKARLCDDCSYEVSYGRQQGSFTGYRDYISKNAKQEAEAYIAELASEAKSNKADFEIYRNYEL